LSQLSFLFQSDDKKNLFREEDFLLLVENVATVKFLKQFFAQQNFSNSQFPSAIIKGAKHSGKTHLLHFLSEKFFAENLSEEKISHLNLANFFTENKFYIYENFEEIKSEELLLHLINSAFEAQAFLILTTNGSAKFQLKDLNSRLKNIFVSEIKNPSHESIKQLLVNGFAQRQIKLSSPIIDFISDNIERSYEAVFAAIKRIEFQAQESGKNITMKEMKEIFKKSLID
jgi:chromosomal replication initiation ATPase DnaA